MYSENLIYIIGIECVVTGVAVYPLTAMVITLIESYIAVGLYPAPDCPKCTEEFGV